MNDFVKAHCITHPLLYHQGSIEHQVVRGHDVQHFFVSAQNPFHSRALIQLPGDNHRLIPQILWCNGLLLGQGCIPPHENSPGIPIGKLQGFVFGGIRIAQQQSKVNESPVQFLCHRGAVAAVDVEMHQGMFPLQCMGRPCQHPHPLCLPGAQGDVTGNHLIGQSNLILCLFHQLQNLCRPFAKDHPLFRQGNFSVTPNKELLAQLLLQLFQLSG